MPKKKKKSLVITKQSKILDDIPKLITTTAMEHFPLFLEDASLDISLQIALLKRYAFRYSLDINGSNEASEAIKKDPKLAKELISSLEKIHAFFTTEAFASKSENRERLQSIRNRHLTGVSVDKFNFKNTVNKYSSFINLNLSISDLNDENLSLYATKRIFVLFNQALPYYPSEIRCCFDLEQLFVKFEKIRQPFFENLTLLLSKASVPENPEFLLKQVQVYVLCATMMWINHAKILDSDLDSAIFLVLDTLSTLLPNRLKDFMFMNPSLEEIDITTIFPSPLNIVAVLIEYYHNENLLSSLQTIKKCFIDKIQENYLQNSLKKEFIFFLNRLLTFVSNTNETGYCEKIQEYYNNFLPLIDELIKSFEGSSQIDELYFLNSIKTNWDNFINENNQACQKSEQNGSQLIHEREKIKAEFQQEQQAKAQAIQKIVDENVAKRFLKKKEKEAQEEALSELKMQKRLADSQMSPLDQLHNKLQCQIASECLGQNLSIDEKFAIKEKISIEEICKCLKIDPVDKVDEHLLVMLKNCILALGDELSLNERHTLLIHSISLADNYLSRVTNRITFYKKNYAPSLKIMTDRHGQDNFGKSDHEAYQKIKNFMEPALKNLMLTGVDCECLLTIFEMIACLKIKIENKEFYRQWNSSAAFRNEEHKDLYKSFLENLQQLKTYRESKNNAFMTSVPKEYKKNKKNKNVKIDGKMIAKTLESLITAIKKITEILATNDEGMGYIANVSLRKEDQFREAQLQSAVIDENKIRKPIKYNPYESFRRSQSFHKSGITENHTENDLTKKVNFVRSRRVSM